MPTASTYYVHVTYALLLQVRCYEFAHQIHTLLVPVICTKYIHNMYIVFYREDEYHVALICEYFKNIREKYIKPYYYTRPSMIKFIELMNTPNSKERFRMMLFLKIVFKLYAETLKQ